MKDMQEWINDRRTLEGAIARAGGLSHDEVVQLAYDLAEIMDVCRTLPKRIQYLRELLSEEPQDAIKLVEILHDLIGELSYHLPVHLRKALSPIQRIIDRFNAQLEESGMDDLQITEAMERARKARKE